MAVAKVTFAEEAEAAIVVSPPSVRHWVQLTAALASLISGGILGFSQIGGQPEKIQPVTIEKIRQNIRKFPKLFFIILAIVKKRKVNKNKTPNFKLG